jgi:hypothetical protein
MPWSVREDLCLLVAAAGFKPMNKNININKYVGMFLGVDYEKKGDRT